ncbi:MAG: FKBP-type peptidyl-prolyl cis-trans isomerase [Pseudomonadales bacterium]|nr:FKBP-type peptidyl-prolyl cis-trans isomerase [Pseudomonadales bacterium]
MKAQRTVIFALAASSLVAACNQQQPGLPRSSEIPETEQQKQSYALGQSMSANLQAGKIDYDPAFFNAGFYDAAEGVKRMTQEEMTGSLRALQQQTQARQMAERTSMLETNQQTAEKYLAENASAEGVVTTESGLQYKVLSEASGDKPSAEDTVTVHYEGRLVDGTIFDSSIERGTPATFPVGGVIAGWTEALQLMSVGSKWQLTIPPALGYGERGAGERIQPNSALIFDVELIGIEEEAD